MTVAGRVPPDFIGDESHFIMEWSAGSYGSCPHKETGKDYFFGISFFYYSIYLHQPGMKCFSLICRLGAGPAFTIIISVLMIPAAICIGCCISFVSRFRKDLNLMYSYLMQLVYFMDNISSHPSSPQVSNKVTLVLVSLLSHGYFG